MPLVLLVSIVGPAGAPDGWGYALGRVALAYAVSRLAGPGAARNRRAEFGLLVTIALPAALAASAWRSAGFGLDLRTYYLAVVALGIAIAFYYALRLVERPERVLALAAALGPYYALGIAWAALYSRVGGADAAPPTALVDLAFHGLLLHLPGDILMAVAVAFLTGPREGRAGPQSR